VDQLTGHAGELRLLLGTSLDLQNPRDEGFFILQGDINGDGNPDFEVHALVNDIGIVNSTTDFLL
jgi:hypothetical protein